VWVRAALPGVRSGERFVHSGKNGSVSERTTKLRKTVAAVNVRRIDSISFHARREGRTASSFRDEREA